MRSLVAVVVGIGVVVVVGGCVGCVADPGDGDDVVGGGGEGGEGEGEGEGGEGGEDDARFFDFARAIACRAAGCFDTVVFCVDGRCSVDVGGGAVAGSYERDGDRVVVDYGGAADVFVEADGVFVRDRDGAEFVNELVDPAACD